MSLSRLRLYQLVSPALPVGAFSYSEGLEVLVQRGQLAEVAALEGWLIAELERGLVAIEAAALGPLMEALAQGTCRRRPNSTVGCWPSGRRRSCGPSSVKWGARCCSC